MLKPMKIKISFLVFLLAFVQLISLYGCGGGGGNDNPPPPPPPVPIVDDGVSIPDWVKNARVAALDLSSDPDDVQLEQLIIQRSSENVSVAVIDRGLAEYMQDTVFNNKLGLLNTDASKVHAKGMKAIVFYPFLEVFTENAFALPNSMYKDHPDWVEKSLDGTDNVVKGILAEPNETAWMSPNGPYKQYYLDRITQLAATGLDGVWIEAPVYRDMDSGFSKHAAESFRLWSISKRFGGASGLSLPAVIDVTDPTFRIWLKWRHENLAQVLDEIKTAANTINPNFMVIVETPAVDDLEVTVSGIDGAYRVSADNFIRVYKIDTISTTKGMDGAHPEDFTSLIAMSKWAKESERGNPNWSYSFGNQALDAGLVISALISNGVSPFEAKTPTRNETVSSTFRKDWFGFIKNNSDLIFNPQRLPQVGIWYDSNSRDFGDHMEDSGESGKYINTAPLVTDPDWWTFLPTDSSVHKPHLGGWRGMANSLIEMGIAFKPVIAQQGISLADIASLKVIILPSVTSVSAKEAQVLKDYVSQGGILIANNEVPGQLDEWGNTNAVNPLEDLFTFKLDEFENRMNVYGKGVSIFRPSNMAANFYLSKVIDKKLHYNQVSELERFIRIHIPKTIELKSYENLYLEQAILDENTSVAYFVNYAGLKQPVIKNVRDITLTLYPPPDKALNTITAYAPTVDGVQGNIAFTEVAPMIYQATVKIDQLAILKFDYVDATVSPNTYDHVFNWPAGWEEAATGGLKFILEKMRDPNRNIPYRYGVFTNLIDNTEDIPIYAYGHHHTAEHMGLLLRTTACMQNQQAYEEGFSFVEQAMVSPVFNTVQWAVHKTEDRAYLELNDYDEWSNANAPLDDFRVLRGILEGHRNFDLQSSLDVALKAFNGTYWTTVTDRDYKAVLDYPLYSEGIMGYAFDSVEVNAPAKIPILPTPALATGVGTLSKTLIPVDYQDLYTIGLAAKYDIKWKGVLNSATKLLLDSEIPVTPATPVAGLYYNGLQIDGVLTGDFENRDNNSGKHLKTIQELWTALHLIRIGLLDDAYIDPQLKAAGKDSSERSYAFFKSFYQTNNRIPEYLTVAGIDVPACTTPIPTPPLPLSPADCLIADFDNLVAGEARIYAQLARLAYYHNDIVFAIQVVNDKIMTDRVPATDTLRGGMIGISTANENDSEAWNTLEPLLTMCLIAKKEL